MAKVSPKRLYLIPVLSKALDVLEILQRERKPMSLETMHQRTRISKTTVYRILKTLTHRGYIAQSQDGLYRPISSPTKKVFGFGSQSSEMAFSQAVTKSLQSAAADTGIDLLILDNQYDPTIAVRNADEFIRHGVDLVIDFQVDQDVAAIIGDKIAGAGIPLIAVDIPHPHAVFFGVDNFRVGFEAGQLLARYASRIGLENRPGFLASILRKRVRWFRAESQEHSKVCAPPGKHPHRSLCSDGWPRVAGHKLPSRSGFSASPP